MSLPFENDSFDAALAVLTVHHWPNTALGLGELRRVARSDVVVGDAESKGEHSRSPGYRKAAPSLRAVPSSERRERRIALSPVKQTPSRDLGSMEVALGRRFSLS